MGKPTFIVLGGLVILQGSLPLLLEARNNRLSHIDQALASASTTEEIQDPPKQICICGGVLPHGINLSYGGMVSKIVQKINGTEVKDMKHLANLISGQEAGTLIIDFKVPKGRQFIVFDMAEIRASEEEILKANSIPHWCTPSLLEAD